MTKDNTDIPFNFYVIVNLEEQGVVFFTLFS